MPDEQVVEPKADDLVSRVANFNPEKTEEPPKTEPVVDDGKFDYSKLKTITTPEEAQAWAEQAHKSFQRDYTKKTEELATLRKQLESQPEWTPQRIEEALKNEQFVSSATEYMKTQNPQGSGKTDEEWSNLSDEEKLRIKGLETKITFLEQQNMRNQMMQQDEVLKSKYANYDSTVVDETIRQIQAGKLVVDRETVWQVIDYKNGIDRAYKLGMQDGRGVNRDKADSIAFTSGVNVSDEAVIKKGEKETDSQYFQRLYEHNKQKSLGR